MLIALAGLSGSGKDTIAEILQRREDFDVIGFSDSLKKVVADLFGYKYEMLQALIETHRIERSTIDTRYGKTPEQILKEVGVKMREVYPLIFAEKTLNDLNPNRDTVITDLRYPNEIDAVRSYGGEVWRVTRGELPEWAVGIRNSEILSTENNIKIWEKGEKEVHESMWRMQCHDVKFDHEIPNHGSLEDLENIVMETLA